MASQLPAVYRDLVRLSMAKMAERYGVELSIPQSAQANRDAWDVHQEPCSYEKLQDSFLGVLESFEAAQGHHVEGLFTKHPEVQMLIQNKEYIRGVMEDMGSDTTYDTLGAMLSCASFLNHSCEHLIKHDAALVNSEYVEALVSSLKVHTDEAWHHICSDMISM
jgi:hypothetical protein